MCGNLLLNLLRKKCQDNKVRVMAKTKCTHSVYTCKVDVTKRVKNAKET